MSAKNAPAAGSKTAKTRVRRASGSRSPDPNEYIKVVPVHAPKPTLSIDEVGAAGRELTDADLFAGKLQAPAAPPHLAYSNGPLLTTVQVCNIFWGRKWSSGPGAAIAAKLNDFYKAILVSPLIDQLAEYSVPGKSIGHGSFIGANVITVGAPVGSVTDSTIRTRLKSWIAAGTVPPTTANTLYFIYLDPGVVSIMGGAKSCSSYCGYHDAVGRVYYAVMPYPNCAGCLGGMTAFDALTGTSSHELCEAITDPVPGSGWYDNQNGEVGDICAWQFKKVAGFTVQLEWSNVHKRCV